MSRINWKWFIQGWFTRPDVSALESFLMRFFFAMIVAFTLRFTMGNLNIEPHPVGLLRILHSISDRTWLGWLTDDNTFDIYRGVIYVLLVFYTAGLGLPLVLPVLTVMHTLPFTLFDSQGYPHHGNQIVSLLLLVQSGTVLWHCIRERTPGLAPPGAILRGWLQWQSVTLIAGTYFVSVITKMEQSRGMWLWNANNFALDMVKTQRQAWLNRLSPELADIPANAMWMLQHPWTARVVFGSGMILETISIFAIGNRTIGLAVGLSYLVMHRSIDALMGGVAFPYNELLDIVFFCGLPFGLAWLLEKCLPKAVAWGVVIGGIAGVPLSWFAQPENHHIPDFGSYLQATVTYLGVWDSQRWGDFFDFIWPEMLLVCAGTAALGAGAALMISRWKQRPPGGSVPAPE